MKCLKIHNGKFMFIWGQSFKTQTNVKLQIKMTFMVFCLENKQQNTSMFYKST